MKKILLTSLVILFLCISGCTKRVVNSSAEMKDKNLVLDSLNNQNPDEALILINAQLKDRPNDSELLFYKASALAMKGGIDLFTLYPLLEMKLFHEPIVNWGNLKKYENPYKRFFIFNMDYLKININKKLKNKLKYAGKKLEKKIKNISLKDVEDYFDLYDKINKKYFKGKYSLSGANKDYLKKLVDHYTNNREKIKKLRYKLRKVVKKAKKDYKDIKTDYENRLKKEFAQAKGDLLIDNETDVDSLIQFEDNEEQVSSKNNDELDSDTESLDDLLNKLVTIQRDTYNTTKAIDKTVGEHEVVIDYSTKDTNTKLDLNFIKKHAMQILWSIYMTIPAATIIPTIKKDNYQYFDEALMILNTLIDRNDGFSKRSKHYLSFLSAASFLSLLKEMVVVEDTIDPLGFICTFNYKTLFQSYFRIHNYINYFMRGATGLNISKKYFVKIESFMLNVENEDGDLSDEAKMIITDSMKSAKNKLCDISEEMQVN